MVDTIKILVCPASPPKTWEEGYQSVDPATGVIVRQRGRFGNFRVFYNPAGVLTAEGSLPKLLFGENVRAPSRAEVEAGVWMLANGLGFHPSAARISKLHLAYSLPLPRPVPSYFSVFGSAPRMRRLYHEGQTLTWYNKRRSASFYDKAEEAGCEGFRLRFEVQYRKKLSDQVGWQVFLCDLYDPDRFEQLVRLWHRQYRAIRKVERPLLVPVSSVRTLHRQVEAAGVAYFGSESALIAQIDAWPLPSRVKAALRAAVRRWAGAGACEDDALLIRELDAAMEQAVRRALALGTRSQS